MDGWSRVRDLAPDTVVDESALDAARRRLEREMADAAPSSLRRVAGAASGRRTAAIVAVLAVAAVASVVVIAAILRPSHPPIATAPTPGSSPEQSPSADPEDHLCGDIRIPHAALTDPLRVVDLDGAGRAAVEQARAGAVERWNPEDPVDWAEDWIAGLADLEEWIVASRTADELVLVTDVLHAHYTPVTPVPVTHEALVLVREGGEWRARSFAACALPVDAVEPRHPERVRHAPAPSTRPGECHEARSDSPESSAVDDVLRTWWSDRAAEAT